MTVFKDESHELCVEVRSKKHDPPLSPFLDWIRREQRKSTRLTNEYCTSRCSARSTCTRVSSVLPLTNSTCLPVRTWPLQSNVLTESTSLRTYPLVLYGLSTGIVEACRLSQIVGCAGLETGSDTPNELKTLVPFGAIDTAKPTSPEKVDFSKIFEYDQPGHS